MNNEQSINEQSTANSEQVVANEQSTANSEQATANEQSTANKPICNDIEKKVYNGVVLTQAQLDLKTALETVMQSISETLISADKAAFKFAWDIKRCYDLITEYRDGTKEPFYFNGMKFSKVEDFAKTVFGLSKSAFLSKVKLAGQFCNKQGLPDPDKTKGLKYSSLQDVTADEIAVLEKKYNALPVKEGKKKPAFADLSIKSIRALKNAANVLITEGGIIDAAKALPEDSKPEKTPKQSKNLDSDKPELNAREKALNAVKAYIETCSDKEELKSFIAEIMAFKGNE